jgi:hypothetical protein
MKDVLESIFIKQLYLSLQKNLASLLNPIYLYSYDPLSHSLDIQSIYINIQS